MFCIYSLRFILSLNIVFVNILFVFIIYLFQKIAAENHFYGIKIDEAKRTSPKI